MGQAGGHAHDLARVKHALLHGVQIVTSADPDEEVLANTPSVRRHMQMCKERAQYYVEIGALELLEEEPAIVQPLHVVTREGRKPRLVLDLSRNLNDLLDNEHFSHQTLLDAVAHSYPQCWYGKMDLANCFLSFDVHPDSRRYLAFELDGTFYRFKRLPFGLSSAPFWCDMFLRVIDFALRERGICHVRYCDDFLLIGASPSKVAADIQAVRSILQEHGLDINEAKTEGPAQRMVFLGLGLDSREQVLFVPDDKINKARALMGNFRTRSHTTRKHIQSLVGQLSFISTALPGARPFYRNLIDATRFLQSPMSPVTVTAGMKEDIDIWSRFLSKWNGRERWRAQDESIIDHDASKSGFGFLLTGVPRDFDVAALPDHLRPGHAYAGFFSSHELGTHVAHCIQWPELFAIAFGVATYAPYMRDADLLVRTDNETDFNIINRRRTTSPQLLQLLRYIYITCAHYNISIRAEHIAGNINTIPDILSRPKLHAFRARVVHPQVHDTILIHYVHSSSFVPPADPHRPAAISCIGS
jgi:hypothetical protein